MVDRPGAQPLATAARERRLPATSPTTGPWRFETGLTGLDAGEASVDFPTAGGTATLTVSRTQASIVHGGGLGDITVPLQPSTVHDVRIEAGATLTVSIDGVLTATAPLTGGGPAVDASAFGLAAASGAPSARDVKLWAP